MAAKLGYGLTLVAVSVATGGLIGLVFHAIYGMAG